MKKIIVLCLLLIPLYSFPQTDTSKTLLTVPLNDGPYIFNINDTFKIKWIENDTLKEDWFDKKSYGRIRESFALPFNYCDITGTYLQEGASSQSFYGIDSIIAISDVHGQYDIYINLLKANGVIDDNLNWSFGKGHLVFMGDAFDRGEMVTEILLHLFGLEKLAAEAGGMVHVLLGNHEAMVLANDLRYINEKYKKTVLITSTGYNDLYSDNSLLGKWLRSKPIVITINDILFVHAGISPELAQKMMTITQINKVFHDSIIGKESQMINKNEELKFLNGSNGPLWYRGYFTDTTFTGIKLNTILNFYDKEHIIVGHTTYKEFKLMFNNKIIGIDEGIGYKQPGAVLIYKEGCFYKGTDKGNRIRLSD